MTLGIIGPGYGRTGTKSTKDALELLGFAPCHRRYEIFANTPHVAFWQDVAEGWAPLCRFLDLPMPFVPFPHENKRDAFWNALGGEPAET